MKKYFAGGVIVLGLCIFGFVSLIRGCLSEYDERSGLPPSLFFEQSGKPVIFSLVKYGKATSYSRNGGFIRKSMSTSYYVQVNDGITSNKIAAKKVKDHGDIKNYPVELIGAASNLAWLFLGELMAFNPFTLETVVDLKLLEEKNPVLKDKFPSERRFYEFDENDGSIFFASKDGYKWKLDSKTLLVSKTERNAGESLEQGEIKRLLTLQKKIVEDFDSLYKSSLRSGRDAHGNAYMKLLQDLSAKRNMIYRQRDSLQAMIGNLRNRTPSRLNLQRNSPGFSQIKINQDTIANVWYGMYSAAEIGELNKWLHLSAIYNQAERRKFHMGRYRSSSPGSFEILKESLLSDGTELSFLDGGFLLDKNTALPIHLNDPASHLVVSKDVIGNDGKIILARITNDGKVLWTFESGLKEWSHWIVRLNRLYVFGVDIKELSSSDCNILYSIDLASGKESKYDFFKDESLK
ncbi:MAG: PA2928 family protein [Chitinophagaceae bacterium]